MRVTEEELSRRTNLFEEPDAFCELTSKRLSEVDTRDHLATEKVTFKDFDGHKLATSSIFYPADASMTWVAGSRHLRGGATPVFRAETDSGETVYELQYTWDGDDERPRVNIVHYPDNPPKQESEKRHPSASSIVTIAPGIGSISTVAANWHTVD